MLKKGLFLLFMLIMVFILFGCGEDRAAPEEELDDPVDEAEDEELEWKIGIMTSTAYQNEEEFLMAAAMLEKYGPDKIVHATYPERFIKEREETSAAMLEMASDSDLKAIIMVQAVPGAVAAVEKVREVRPDMLVILGSPQEDPDAVARVGDIILRIDEIGRGYQIAEQAAEMGAEVLVHYSFPRHMSIERLVERRRLMQERAEDLGLLFVDEEAPDPGGEVGALGTQQFITEDVSRKIEQYGPDTAVFGTTCVMMEPMIKQVVEYGGIFPAQCCPSPYHGMPSAFGIEIPGDKKGDVSWLREQIASRIFEAGASGRVATWPVPVNMLFIEAGVEYAREWIHGNTTGTVDKAKMIEIMEGISGYPASLSEYREMDNYFLYLSDHFIF